jgi:hypothetical protein
MTKPLDTDAGAARVPSGRADGNRLALAFLAAGETRTA